jgi:hypothetical protein
MVITPYFSLISAVTPVAGRLPARLNICLGGQQLEAIRASFSFSVRGLLVPLAELVANAAAATPTPANLMKSRRSELDLLSELMVSPRFQKHSERDGVLPLLSFLVDVCQ